MTNGPWAIVGSGSDQVEAAVAVPRYFEAYEKAFGLPVHRPVSVMVVVASGVAVLGPP